MLPQCKSCKYNGIRSKLQLPVCDLEQITQENKCNSYIGGPPQKSELHNELTELTTDLVELLCSKNSDYGNSYFESLDEWGATSFLIRASDKLNRLKSLAEKQTQIKEESIKDTLIDLAGYCLLTVVHLESQIGDDEIDGSDESDGLG